eukprot:scaffold502_cov271-Prasinococcus_capsulatus_cf.AAC.4
MTHLKLAAQRYGAGHQAEEREADEVGDLLGLADVLEATDGAPKQRNRTQRSARQQQQQQQSWSYSEGERRQPEAAARRGAALARAGGGVGHGVVAVELLALERGSLCRAGVLQLRHQLVHLLCHARVESSHARPRAQSRARCGVGAGTATSRLSSSMPEGLFRLASLSRATSAAERTEAGGSRDGAATGTFLPCSAPAVVAPAGAVPTAGLPLLLALLARAAAPCLRCLLQMVFSHRSARSAGTFGMASRSACGRRSADTSPPRPTLSRWAPHDGLVGCSTGRSNGRSLPVTHLLGVLGQALLLALVDGDYSPADMSQRGAARGELCGSRVREAGVAGREAPAAAQRSGGERGAHGWITGGADWGLDGWVPLSSSLRGAPSAAASARGRLRAAERTSKPCLWTSPPDCPRRGQLEQQEGGGGAARRRCAAPARPPARACTRRPARAPRGASASATHSTSRRTILTVILISVRLRNRSGGGGGGGGGHGQHSCSRHRRGGERGRQARTCCAALRCAVMRASSSSRRSAARRVRSLCGAAWRGGRRAREDGEAGGRLAGGLRAVL